MDDFGAARRRYCRKGFELLTSIASCAFIGAGTEGVRHIFTEVTKEPDEPKSTTLTSFDPLGASAEELEEKYNLSPEHAKNLCKDMNYSPLTPLAACTSAFAGNRARNFFHEKTNDPDLRIITGPISGTVLPLGPLTLLEQHSYYLDHFQRKYDMSKSDALQLTLDYSLSRRKRRSWAPLGAVAETLIAKTHESEHTTQQEPDQNPTPDTG